MILALLPPAALVGLAIWAFRRGINSAKEDMKDTTNTDYSDLPSTILGAIGWPYYYGKGSPSTPWSDGPKGVDCSGFVQMALVKLGKLSSTATDRGATQLANDSNPIATGQQKTGDIAVYNGHVMLVAGPPGADGHSPVIGASGGHTYTLGNDPNARVKLFTTAKYRNDFLTYARLK